MRRRTPAPSRPTVRDFIPAEVEQLRSMLASWPRPSWREFEAVHAAAGRRRSLMLWELDCHRGETPLEDALAEEVAGGLDQHRFGAPPLAVL